jgi:hypothetical protein
MAQLFILPKSVLQYNGQSIRVDFWEWAQMTLTTAQLEEFDQDMASYYSYVDELIDSNRFQNENIDVEVLPNGDNCETFIILGAPTDIPDTHVSRLKWEAIFAADPNVTYSGSVYTYVRDV